MLILRGRNHAEAYRKLMRKSKFSDPHGPLLALSKNVEIKQSFLRVPKPKPLMLAQGFGNGEQEGAFCRCCQD